MSSTGGRAQDGNPVDDLVVLLVRPRLRPGEIVVVRRERLVEQLHTCSLPLEVSHILPPRSTPCRCDARGEARHVDRSATHLWTATRAVVDVDGRPARGMAKF